MSSRIPKNKAKQDWNWRPQSIPTCGYACDFDVYWKCRKSLALKKENAQWNEKIQLIHNKFVSFKQARCYYLIMGQNNRNHFFIVWQTKSYSICQYFQKILILSAKTAPFVTNETSILERGEPVNPSPKYMTTF